MTITDSLAAIISTLTYVAPFIYAVTLFAVLVLYKKWSFVPISFSCIAGVVGVFTIIKPGGWGFQYLAAPWMFVLFGCPCLLIAIIVHFKRANKQGPFYVSLSFTIVFLVVVLGGTSTVKTNYDNDRKFWRDAVASDAYLLDAAIYQRHLSSAGKEEIERLKYDNCRRMSKEFISQLFSLGINVESCTNASEEVMRSYKEKRMVSDIDGSLKNSFKQKDANILALNTVALDAEYKKLDFNGVVSLCAEMYRYNRNKTNDTVKFSTEVVEHELANLVNGQYDEAQVRKQIGRYLPKYLTILALSASTEEQVLAVYDYIQNLKFKYGKDAFGWKYRIPLDRIIENDNTPDDLFYELLNLFINERKFGFVSDVVAHSNRLPKDRLLDYAKHGNADVRIAALTNQRLSENEIYELLEGEQKEKVILAGLSNIAERDNYVLERLIIRFEKIKWRMGGGERSSPAPVLAALIRSGYDDSWIYSSYLYGTKDRNEIIKFVLSLDSAKKRRFIEGKYGSYFLDGHQYLLNYLEEDQDPEVVRQAKAAKVTRYRL